MTLRVVIVDDEPLAREGLRGFLDEEADCTVVAESGSAAEAIEAITNEEPDLVLLDIQMSGPGGFDVLAALPPPLPVVVFVTAHDRFALDAFHAHAIDYLLKPVARERFQVALARARAQIAHDRGAELDARLRALLADRPRQHGYLTRLTIRDGATVRFVPVASVDWIEAAGNYAKVHAGGTRHLLRETMTTLEASLDPDRFVRIHRSTIVNVERIREIQPWFRSDHMVILHDGTRLSLTRKYRGRLI